MHLLREPTRLYLDPSIPEEQAKRFLTYRDLSVEHDLRKFKHNRWLAQKLTPEEWTEQLQELEAQRQKCLLFQDEHGSYTHAGLKNMIEGRFGGETENPLVYPDPRILPWATTPPDPRPYQDKAKALLLATRHAAVNMGCHRRGEKVLMFDGSSRSVEDVVVGDQLMGPDSCPRKVLALKRGVDSMYEIQTVNGQRMYVNGNHILALRRTNKSREPKVRRRKRYPSFKGKNPIVFRTVKEYVASSTTFKWLYKLYSTPVEFLHRDVPLDPYFLGVLLGDGSLWPSIGITTMDPEIEQCVRDFAKSSGLDVRAYSNGSRALTYYLSAGRGVGVKKFGRNPLRNAIRDLGLLGVPCDAKFVPELYKVNSREVRLQVLAGLIDTDGSAQGGCYDFISKSKHLADDVAFLARSLGLRATQRVCTKKCQTGAVGTYYRVALSGDLSVVPVRLPRKRLAPRRQIKNPTTFGFQVAKVADAEEHFGFELDGDHLYLTDSFLVTHNTGLGKSFIIMHICRSLGLKAVVMAPLTSIAEQLYDDFCKYLGPKWVGFYGDGKKHTNKLITIAIGASLARVQKGTKEFEALSKAQVFIADESHQTPASTLTRVCLDLLKDAPYRFFFSGTQTRTDGAELLLKGIIGPIVFQMSVRDGVDQGYLAKPIFKFYRVTSDSPMRDGDPNKMTRQHLFYNPKVNALAGSIANGVVKGLDHSVLILIDEMEQFTKLLPHFRYEVGFAHGGVTKDNRDKVPSQYHRSDPKALVKAFNDRKLRILVGTSCIATGTDIKAVKTLIYIRGGKSEIELGQGLGRGTRLFEHGDYKKTTFNYVDFLIDNVDVVRRHAEARMEICDSIYGPVRVIDA